MPAAADDATDAASTGNGIDPFLERRFVQASRVLAGCVILLGLVVLAGWWLDIPLARTVLQGAVSMRVNTAFGLVAAGTAVLALRAGAVPQRVAQVIGGALFLLGAASLSQDVSGRDLGIDELLFDVRRVHDEWSGRMSPITALGFAACGLSLAAGRDGHPEARLQAGALLAGALGTLGVAGYIFNEGALLRIGPFRAIAIHTAIGMTALALAVVLARARDGWMTIVASAGPDGVLARRLLPVALGAPLLLALIQRAGQLSGWFDRAFGEALFSITLIASFASGILFTARALRRSEEGYRHIVEGAAGHAIFMLDADGAIASWNQGGERLFGWSERQIVGSPWATICPPTESDADRAARSLRVAAETGSCSDEGRMHARDGRPFRASSTLTAIRGADGSLRGYSVVIRDITALHETRQQLETEHELARVTLRAIGDGVVVTDTAGRIEQLNDTAMILAGLSESDARGREISTLFRQPGDDGDVVPFDPVRVAFEAGHVVPLPERARLVSRDLSEMALEGSCAPIRLGGGQLRGAVVVFRDVTESRRLLHDVQWQASHDGLTGLANRREFEQRLRRLTERSSRAEPQHALLVFDLDGFKAVNDACGHPAGDRLLVELARRFETCVRERDTIARIGGDEFAVILEHCDLSHARQIAEKLLWATREHRFVCDGQVLRVGASIGLVPFPAGACTMDDVMRLADGACYAAKARGRHRIVVRQPGDPLGIDTDRERGFADRLRRAIEEDRVLLCILPIASLDDRPDGERFEVLTRIRDDDGSLVLPAHFVGTAERNDLMPAIDRRVVESTLRRLAADPDRLAGLALCAVNVSPRTLADAGFTDHVARMLDETGVPAQRLCFEVAERDVLADPERIRRAIAPLQARGCRFAIDDFGAGIGALAHLQQLPVDYVKISGQFVSAMRDDPVSVEMVRAVNEVSHLTGKRTVAEFVADREVMALLRRLGVDYAQGHLIGQPREFA